MRRTLLSHLAIVLAVCIAGCGTSQQMVRFPDQSKYVEDQGKGRIYLIGSPLSFNLASHGTTATVIADDKHIGYIAGHRYLCWEREPGISTISGQIHKIKSVVNLFVENGKVYYILAHIGPDWKTINPLIPIGSGEMSVRLEIVNDDVGKKALLESKPSEKK